MLHKTKRPIRNKNEENCKIFAKYFEKLFNCPKPAQRFPPQQHEEMNLSLLLPDRDKIVRQIIRCKTYKKFSKDGFIAEPLNQLDQIP